MAKHHQNTNDGSQAFEAQTDELTWSENSTAMQALHGSPADAEALLVDQITLEFCQSFPCDVMSQFPTIGLRISAENGEATVNDSIKDDPILAAIAENGGALITSLPLHAFNVPEELQAQLVNNQPSGADSALFNCDPAYQIPSVRLDISPRDGEVATDIERAFEPSDKAA